MTLAQPLEGASTATLPVRWIFETPTSSGRTELIALLNLYPLGYSAGNYDSSLSSIGDPWMHTSGPGASIGFALCRRRLLISDLGWSPEQARETYMRLRHFEEDWNAPGMDAYDDL